MTYKVEGNQIVFSEKVKKNQIIKVYFTTRSDIKMTEQVYPVCSTKGNGSDSLDWFESMKIVGMYISKPIFFGLFGGKTEEVFQIK